MFSKISVLEQAHKKDVIRRYNERLAKYGYDPRSLGWLKGRQTVRFTVLSEIGDIKNSCVLDVGCGFGDLYGFFKKIGVKVKYTGCDINSNLIATAKERYPKGKFLVADIDSNAIHGSFDWVFATGVFEFKYPNMLNFVKHMLTKMFNLTKKGVAADFMSSYVDYKGKDGFYASPEKIFRIAKGLSRGVTLRHDYMPFEFCIYIYKDNKINRRNVFSSFDARLAEKLGTPELFPIRES